MQAQATPEHRRMIPVDGHPGVFKRGNRYVVTWRYRGKLRKSYHRTLTEARRAKGKRASGETEPAARQRFDRYAREWVRTYQGRTRRGISDTTRASYTDAIERFAIPHFGTARLGEITPRTCATSSTRLPSAGSKAARSAATWLRCARCSPRPTTTATCGSTPPLGCAWWCAGSGSTSPTR